MTITNSQSHQFRLIGAPFTPFDASGALDVDAVAKHAAHMRQSGLVGAFVGGTTGESASLTIPERKQLAEAWRKESGDLKIIAHVGSANLSEAEELAAHAQSIGADAIGAVPPYYFRPGNVDALVNSMAIVAAAAPNLPYYYYHIPALTRVELPMALVMQAAMRRIPNFAGIKFTHSDMQEYADLVEIAGNEFEVMCGKDSLLLFALSAGGRAAVGATYMFAAGLYHEQIRAFNEGRWTDARAATSASLRLVALCAKHGGLVAQKAIYGMAAPSAGPVRPPFTALPDAAAAELRAFVDSGGLKAIVPH